MDVDLRDDELAALLDTYEKTTAAKLEARRALYAHILGMVAAGATQIEVALRLGKSRSRAQQLIKQARRDRARQMGLDD